MIKKIFKDEYDIKININKMANLLNIIDKRSFIGIGRQDIKMETT